MANSQSFPTDTVGLDAANEIIHGNFVTSYDVIVIGAGGVGSAALFHLAKRGAKVLGLDRFPLDHDRGSSHGRTRVIRRAYFEHADYVPLLLRAYELWSELSDRCGLPLCHETGLLEVGLPTGQVIPGVKRAAREHRLEIEALSPADVRKRFPAFQIPGGYEAVFERRAGYLDVESCVRAHADEAQKLAQICSSMIRREIGTSSTMKWLSKPIEPSFAPKNSSLLPALGQDRCWAIWEFVWKCAANRCSGIRPMTIPCGPKMDAPCICSNCPTVCFTAYRKSTNGVSKRPSTPAVSWLTIRYGSIGNLMPPINHALKRFCPSSFRGSAGRYHGTACACTRSRRMKTSSLTCIRGIRRFHSPWGFPGTASNLPVSWAKP